MKLCVLDTDILTLYQHGHQAVTARIEAHDPAKLAVTIITVEEQLGGWYEQIRKAKLTPEVAHHYESLARTAKSLAILEILNYSEQAIARYEELKSQKLNVRKNDLRIAAIVLEHGGTLITRNLRDFGRVPGLAIEDWSV